MFSNDTIGGYAVRQKGGNSSGHYRESEMYSKREEDILSLRNAGGVYIEKWP